jgi:hypothetical protein
VRDGGFLQGGKHFWGRESTSGSVGKDGDMAPFKLC